MRCTSFISFAVILAILFSPIVSAKCDWTGTYELSQYYTVDPKTGQSDVKGPDFTLQLKQEGPNIKGNFNGVSVDGKVFGSDGTGFNANFNGSTPWPDNTPPSEGVIEGVISLHFIDTQGCSRITGHWQLKDYVGPFPILWGERTSATSGSSASEEAVSPSDIKLTVDHAKDSKGQDDILHPLAIVIRLTENGKPVPNAKLKVHALNLPENNKKLAEYFLASSCTNCPAGHTTIDGKTISMLCPYEVGLNLQCPLKEQKKPLDVTTDANGEARIEFFLPLGRSDAILPSRNSPVTIPIQVEYWKTSSDEKEIKVAEKKYEANLNSIAVVQEILYLAPQDFYGENGSKLSRSTGRLSDWKGDDGVKDDDMVLTGSSRVKVHKHYMLGATTLNKGEGLNIGDEIIINAGGMVSRIRGPINPLVESAIIRNGKPIGAPGTILNSIHFFDGAVGAIQVDGEVPKHVVTIGESASASGFKTMPEKFVGLFADWAISKVNPIEMIKSGIEDAVKVAIPETGFFFIIMELKSKGEDLDILDTIGKPVFIRVQSAVMTSYDDKDQLLVTTREGKATIFTDETGKEGFAVPAGKTAIVNETLVPFLTDTDPETGRDADDLLAVLEDPINTSPVFAGSGTASVGTPSNTSGTAPVSGAASVPGTGNATIGNATNTRTSGGISAPGGPGASGASGTETSTTGVVSPSRNNQIGDTADISAGQSVSQTIIPAGSSNFYSFKADSSGIVKLKLEDVPKDMRPYLCLYDKNMAPISEKSASNAGDMLKLEKDVQGPGQFYIEARDIDGKAHSEPYTLGVTFEPAPDQYEPNPNYFRATQIAQGQSITAYICPSGDEDFYKLYMSSSGIVKATLDSVPADMRSYLELYDKGLGNAIASSSASSPGDKVKLEKDVQGPGWVYIRVQDADGKAHSEPYTLTVTL